MANKPLVREQLTKNGIVIPQDTYFIAGQHDTTTDEVELFDLEDLPPTHRKDVLQLLRDLARASARNNQERCARFPEIHRHPTRVESAPRSSPPEQRLEPGPARMGTVGQRRFHHRQARVNPRRSP